MYNFASDSSFRDVVSCLARGPARFADVWPLIGPAIISGRSPDADEYERLHRLISSDVRDRQAANAALTAPRVHDGKPQISGPSGIGQVSKVDENTIPKAAASTDAEQRPTPVEASTDHVETPEEAGPSTENEAVQTPEPTPAEADPDKE
ncbi:hypothetical protein [Kozakia baliensis]|uniref:Uncharacterized protein n=1 Tax=Kozakia baliensis TaxID=153496 RepID=A0A1D8UTC8_9PROT|nr:hypothetical protein [Kozakia baliensis]AOX16902.1 hypothetical protein A0U89_06885 [Kozakia baliensis]GBR25659.1 hypothetical protein AA0488_0708 [Kozakia baliensis NRIC 0488]GEL64051.1 hypothetical protein KBA01_13370 [Kozakia baliensis]